jgi:hypothetical protein
MCLVVSGVIMFICGVIIMALPFYAAELPTKAIDKQCDATKNSCKTGLGKLDVASLTKYDKINCYTDLKISWGCTCTPSATIACNKPDQFSCKGADGTKYYLAQLYEWWDEGMWIIGGVGLFVCILFIAVPAFLGSVKGAGAVVAYSVCCSIFFIPFLFIGACFLVVGGAFDKKPHLAVDDTLTNLCSSVPSDNHCGTVYLTSEADSVCFRTLTRITMSHTEFSQTFTPIAVRLVNVEKGAHLLILDARAEDMV